MDFWGSGHICEESNVGLNYSKRTAVSDDLREAANLLHRDPYDFFWERVMIMTGNYLRPSDVARLRSVITQCCPVPLTEVGRLRVLPARSLYYSLMAISAWSNLGVGSFSTGRRI